MMRHSLTRTDSLSQSDIRRVLELADGRILAGTSGNGIDIIERQRGVVGGYRAEPGKPTEQRTRWVRGLGEH